MKKEFDAPPVPEIDYEKISYGKAAYQRIQRLRRKAKRRGIEVPYLQYELHKPEKPRVIFRIVGGAGIILLLGILVGTGFLAKYAVDVFSVTFEETGGLFKTLFNPAVFFASMGLSAIPILFLVLAYGVLVLLFAIPVMIAVYCYRFVRDSFYMATCSKEEFAKGTIISMRILRLSVVLIVLLVCLIVIIANDMPQVVKLLLGLICGGIMLLLGGLLAVMAVEKKKCNKWFETLDEDQKRNFLDHNDALRRIRRSASKERRMTWGDF